MKLFNVGCLALFLALPSWAAEAGAEPVISKSFQVAPGGKLRIEADRGQIDVKTAPGDNLQIEVIREGEEDILKKHRVEFTQTGHDLLVKATGGGKAGLWWGGNKLKVKYLVTTPKNYNVDLHTAGGSITVSDLDGEARCQTAGGSLKFGAIGGVVHGRTAGGSIHLEGCAKDVDVETAGGSITIGAVEGRVRAHTSGGSITVAKSKGPVEAETAGGSIHINETSGAVRASTSGGSVTAKLTQQPTGPCQLETSGGSIHVQLAEKLAFDVDAESSGGHVNNEFPVDHVLEKKRNLLRAKINGGGPALKLETSGGSVNIRKI